jgi:hypothetical protein
MWHSVMQTYRKGPSWKTEKGRKATITVGIRLEQTRTELGRGMSTDFDNSGVEPSGCIVTKS